MKKTLSVLLIVLLALALFVSCSKGKTEVAASSDSSVKAETKKDEGLVTVSELGPATITKDTKFQKSIVIATQEGVNVMDPAGSTGVANLIIFWMSHSTLIDIDPLTGNIACDLCESYEQLSDTLWQFNLKKGVKFHNGNELTSEDVKFTFLRAKESNYISDRAEWIEDVICPDKYTVQVQLTAPAQDILFYFSYSAFSIVNKAACEADPLWGTKIGTGPFVISSYEFDNYTELTRFEDYFGEKAHTEKITFRVMPEASTRLVALQTGDVDICVDPAPIDLPNVCDDKNLVLVSGASETMQYLALNLTNDKFKDQRVRQAIAYAINKDSVLQVAKEGHGTIAKTFFSSGWGQATDLEGYTYNPEKAKELLKEAGVSNLEFTIYACDQDKTLAAQVIQENLKNIGITVHVEEIERSALKPLLVKGDFDAALYNWANDSAGPDNNVRPILRGGSSSNRSHFDDPYINDLMDKAMIEGDSAKRLQMYHDIQTYVLDQAPIIPLYYDTNYVAAKKDVHCFKCDPSATHRYADVYIVEK